MIKSKLLTIFKDPVFLTVLLFLMSIVFINPWVNIAINDDWDFFKHIEYFRNGVFMKNALVDATLIIQAYIAFFWSYIFGYSFISFRLLSIVFTIFFLIGCNKILKFFDVSEGARLVSLLTLLFNPLVFMASMSFMTEIYFLTFFVWSLFYFLKYLDKPITGYLILFSLFTMCSILSRQFGLVSFLAYFMVLVPYRLKTRNYLHIFLYLLLVIPAIYLSITYPTHQLLEEKSVFLEGILAKQSLILSQLQSIILLVPYIGFFFLPFGLLKINLRSKKFIAALFLTVLSFGYFYNRDVFALGNTFYIEGLYAKTDFFHYLSLFDNIPFKVFICFISIFSFFNLIFSLPIKLFKPSWISSTLGLLGLGMFSVAFITDGVFDRYFINFFVIAILILAVVFKHERSDSSLVKAAILLLIVFTTILTADYFASEKTKWLVGELLQKEKNTKTGIFVSGVFTRHHNATKFEHPWDIKSAIPQGLNYKCYVQKYSVTSESPIYRVLHRLENSRTLEKFIYNPTIVDSKLTAGVVPINQRLHKIEKSHEYYSPLYYLIGARSFISQYCVE